MERLSDLERKYQEVFSEVREEGNLLRYRDDNIKDMYDHNYTFVKKGVKKEDIAKIIEEETRIRKSEGADFLKVVFEEKIDRKDLPEDNLYSFSDIEAFEIPKEAVYRMKDVKGLEVIVLSELLLEEAEELDEFCAENEADLEFSKRRFERRSKVYLSDKGPDNYLAMLDWEAVGSCDYFSDGRTCMLEDLVVDPEFRNRGIATALLKELSWKAYADGNDLVYLKAYSDSPARDLYIKLGFKVIKTGSCALYRF